MAKLSGQVIDRTGWPAGPWDGEPDQLAWRTAQPPGYPCLIVRAAEIGSLCGYVGVPPGHPIYGHRIAQSDALGALEVHGGITFADRMSDETDDSWWVGFDACHAFDYAPAIKAALASLPGASPAPKYEEPELGEWTGERYRDVAYMRAEVDNLAAQLARIAEDPRSHARARKP